MKQRIITGVLLILLLVVLLWLPDWCMALATLIGIGFAVCVGGAWLISRVVPERGRDLTGLTLRTANLYGESKNERQERQQHG